MRFFSTWCYTPRGVAILGKNRLVMNWCNFLGHEYGFSNAIVSCLIALEALKSQKYLGFCPLKSHQCFTTYPKLQLWLLYNCFFSYKTQCSSTNQTLVKVLGQFPTYLNQVETVFFYEITATKKIIGNHSDIFSFMLASP